MASYCKRHLLLLLSLCSCILLSFGNIHRAVPGTPVFSRLQKVKNNELNDNILLDEEDEEDGFFERIYSKASVAWIYSIPASVLVGSTGIFPLLIFRVEAGQSLKESISEPHLKLLLSFAVGGLLGDVFLHLLPEAWMYAGNDVHDHSGSLNLGLWIIAGLLCFLILEKIFSEEERIQEQQEKLEKLQELKEQFQKTEEMLPQNHKNGFCNGDLKLRKSKTDRQSNGHVNGHVSNGHVSNVNGHLRQNEKVVQNGHSKYEPEYEEEEEYSSDHVKVVGYLNLLANCIDNFTHGLAVAGSFVVSVPVGTCTTFAILLHEIPHEIGDFAILLKAGFNRWDAAKGQLLTASGALFGCLFGLIAEGAGDASAWVLPFTSGGFIYIALVTIVPDLLKEENLRESIKQIIALLFGIAVMGLVTFVNHNPAMH